MKFIDSPYSPRGHYSPGVISGNTLYISGQTSVDPATGLPAEGGFEAEVALCLKKLDKVLENAGCKRSDVIMCHVYVTDIKFWDAANKVYSEFFGDHKPARIVLPVGPMNKGSNVEIEAVAEVR